MSTPRKKPGKTKTKKRSGSTAPLFQSVRNQACFINIADFQAILEFERRHPNLFFKPLSRRECAGLEVFGLMICQANVFNALFNDKTWKDDFKELTAEIKGR